MAGIARALTSIKFNDKNLKKLSSELLKAKNMRVRVGVPSSDFKGIKKDHKTGKISMVELAFVHEFGSQKRNIPERSFLRLGLDKGKKEIIEVLHKCAEDWLAGYRKIGLKTLMAKIGISAQNEVRKVFTDNNWPNDPNSAQYKRKLKKGGGSGSPRALIDTGQLRQSITSEVVTE